MVDMRGEKQLPKALGLHHAFWQSEHKTVRDNLAVSCVPESHSALAFQPAIGKWNRTPQLSC